MSKKRLDILVLEKGLASSRHQAQGLILANQVLVNDVPCTHSGKTFDINTPLRLRDQPNPYVSRAAWKLKAALDHFAIDCQGSVALDIGASTGGFSQVLLEAGAKKVFAVDVGANQLDYRLRQDMRLVVLEKCNARYLSWEQIASFIDIIVMDVAFISQRLLLKPLSIFVQPGVTKIVTLIKPQFEVGKEQVGKKGLVKDPALWQQAIQDVTNYAESLGVRSIGILESPIKGTTGNTEFLFFGIWDQIL